jgi:hypothetical protein
VAPDLAKEQQLWDPVVEVTGRPHSGGENETVDL